MKYIFLVNEACGYNNNTFSCMILEYVHPNWDPYQPVGPIIWFVCQELVYRILPRS